MSQSYRERPNIRIPTYQKRLTQVVPQTIGTQGFPSVRCPWCTGELKRAALTASRYAEEIGVLHLKREHCQNGFLPAATNKAEKINIIHYIGIAADEPKRIERHMKAKDKVMPLVQIGWDEDLCGLIATYLGMLSPTYDGSFRDGCWFCHNQGIAQLRNLRHNYPQLWELLMQWDIDSPVTFHPDGHTVHDFDERFALEDEGLINPKDRFRWAMLEEIRKKLFLKG